MSVITYLTCWYLYAAVAYLSKNPNLHCRVKTYSLLSSFLNLNHAYYKVTRVTVFKTL